MQLLSAGHKSWPRPGAPECSQFVSWGSLQSDKLWTLLQVLLKPTKLGSSNTKAFTFPALSAPSHLISHKSKINQLLKGASVRAQREALVLWDLAPQCRSEVSWTKAILLPSSLSACCCSTADFIVFKETIGKGWLRGIKKKKIKEALWRILWLGSFA